MVYAATQLEWLTWQVLQGKEDQASEEGPVANQHQGRHPVPAQHNMAATLPLEGHRSHDIM
jgi:hypothetical protein